MLLCHLCLRALELRMDRLVPTCPPGQVDALELCEATTNYAPIQEICIVLVCRAIDQDIFDSASALGALPAHVVWEALRGIHQVADIILVRGVRQLEVIMQGHPPRLSCPLPSVIPHSLILWRRTAMIDFAFHRCHELALE